MHIKLARFLIAQGLQPNDVVAIATNRSPEMIILFLALIKAGIAYLPIDRNFPADRITYILKDAIVILLLKSTGDETRYEGNMQEIVQHLQKTFRKYTLKPQDIKIQLFKAAVKMYLVDDPLYFGWKNLALRGVDVHIAPGDHREMFIAPNDKFLAEALQKELDKINC